MQEKVYAVRPNKTQIKRELRVLFELGKELVALPSSRLKKLPLSDSLNDAIRDAQGFRKGALQRQLRFISTMMQHEDVDAIQLALVRLKQPDKQQTARLHQLENWRDRLIQNDEQALDEIIAAFPDVDRQFLRQCQRNAQHELKQNKTPKSARKLFQYLSDCQDQKLADAKPPVINS